MLNIMEQIIGLIYKENKKAKIPGKEHLSEEDLASFADGLMPAEENDLAIKHLLSCLLCTEYLVSQLKIKPHLSLDVSEALLEKIKKLISRETGGIVFEILLKLKEKALELIETSGDVLVGQELIPAPVLRSRNVSEFKEQISILKDFQQIRVMAKIQNRDTRNFSLTITVKDKLKQKPAKDLRISLLKDSVELESYMADSEGSAFFENILPGTYTIVLNHNEKKEAVIDLKVKI